MIKNIFLVSYATNYQYKQTSCMNADCYNCYNHIVLVLWSTIALGDEKSFIGDVCCMLLTYVKTKKYFFYSMICMNDKKKIVYCRCLNVQQIWICFDYTCIYMRCSNCTPVFLNEIIFSWITKKELVKKIKGTRSKNWCTCSWCSCVHVKN